MNENFLKQVFLALTVVVMCIAILLISGCAALEKKGIALETKVIGFDMTVPSTTATGSLMSIRFGYVTTKYLSAPSGTKATISDSYKDINVWSLSGTAESNLMLDSTNQLDTGV